MSLGKFYDFVGFDVYLWVIDNYVLFVGLEGWWGWGEEIGCLSWKLDVVFSGWV